MSTSSVGATVFFPSVGAAFVSSSVSAPVVTFTVGAAVIFTTFVCFSVGTAVVLPSVGPAVVCPSVVVCLTSVKSIEGSVGSAPFPTMSIMSSVARLTSVFPFCKFGLVV